MGKKLIIKGADFSENGIPTNIVDVTNIIFSTLTQGGRKADGTLGDESYRVSGPIVTLQDLSAAAGDLIKIQSPAGIMFGVRHGSADDNLASNDYWYCEDPGVYTRPIQGDTYILNADPYLCLTIGKANATVEVRGTISPSDVQSYIDGGTLNITLVRNSY